MSDYKLVGSAADKFGFYASEGTNKLPQTNRSVLTQDIDINIFVNTLKLRRCHLKAIPGALGFTWIFLPTQEVKLR